MKKNDLNKDGLSFNANSDLTAGIGKIPNPIPAWMEIHFKSYTAFFPADINEGILEGYPIDDDF